MSATISVSSTAGLRVEIYVMNCCSCGLIFGVDNAYDDRRRRDGKTFHCPNGHPQSYTDTEEKRLKRQLEQTRTRLLAEQDQRQAAEDAAGIAQARERRLRWRVANGVCPCCTRTFPQLAAHVQAKHPEQLTQQLEDLSTSMRRTIAALRVASDDEALVDVAELGLDYRSLRALERRGLVERHWSAEANGWSLTDDGWPVAEAAAKERS